MLIYYNVHVLSSRETEVVCVYSWPLVSAADIDAPEQPFRPSVNFLTHLSLTGITAVDVSWFESGTTVNDVSCIGNMPS